MKHWMTRKAIGSANEGRRDGYAWAESGRSLNAVEALYNAHTFVQHKGTGATYQELEARMVAEIGDDDEFEALPTKGVDYRDGWYMGVCDAFEDITGIEAE